MSTLMLKEALSASECIDHQLKNNKLLMSKLGQALRAYSPIGLVTVARGSSDHAAAYLAYLCMSRIGLPVASLPLSLSTLHCTPWRLDRQIAVAISQSGQSFDLLETQRSLKAGGAWALSMVNVEDSPLSRLSDENIQLMAGEECSVAATKSFLASLSAAAHLVAEWSQDQALLKGLCDLPQRLVAAAQQDWSAAVDALVGEERLIIIGRGVSLPVAQEAALKFKETCGMQAEAFSTAEVRHGPMAIIGAGYPVLMFAPDGPEQDETLALAMEFRQRGARVVLAASEAVPERDVTLISVGEPLLEPLSVIQSFYVMVERLAMARGMSPDTPQYLQKVTLTR